MITNKQNPLKILSIDGGGIRGLIAAQILHIIAKFDTFYKFDKYYRSFFPKIIFFSRVNKRKKWEEV
jgi:hypothetical protein